jgi:hypothetical protein
MLVDKSHNVITHNAQLLVTVTQYAAFKQYLLLISGFRRDVDEICGFSYLES